MSDIAPTPLPTPPLSNTFADGHECDFQPAGAHLHVCTLCGAWTHHEPMRWTMEVCGE